MDNAILVSIIVIFLAYYLVNSPKQTQLKNQNTELQKRITELENQIIDLQTENTELKSINTNLQNKITKQRKVISPGIVHNFHDPDLDKIK